MMQTTTNGDITGMRVLIAEDQQIVREGIAALLRDQGIELVGECADGRSAISMSRELRPDLVLMDLVMPELNGIEATRQLKAELPDVKVLGLSAHSDRSTVKQMLQAGAVGFVTKHCSSEELATALRAVHSNQVYLTPSIARVVVDGYLHSEDGPVVEREMPLSPRQREVLQLYAEGKSTKDIAEILHLSVKTVETHRRQIMERLNLRSIAELTRYAIREGITPG